MKLLVAGGAGFIGSHLLEILENNSDIETVVYDNLDTGSEENIPDGIKFIKGDIRSSKMEEMFNEYRFDAVIHLAAQTMVPASIENPSHDCDVNLLGLINVLENCRKYNVATVLFSSSAAVYGDNLNVPLKETETLNPMSFYGITKMSTEHYLRVYSEIYGINTIVFRFANVYGERQGAGGEGGVVSIFAKLLDENKPFTVYGDGKQTRDFVYVGDIAKAMVKGIKLEGHHVINISTEKETSINELIEDFEAASNTNIVVNYETAREGDIGRSVLSNELMKSKLGFEPQIKLREGIVRTYSWYKSKGR